MKVTFLPYKTYSNNVNFRGSASITPPRNDNNKENENKPLPEWARKTMLATVVLMTLKNEPVVQNFFRSNELSKEELDRTEFVHSFQNVRKDKGVSSAFYQLNKLYDIDRPKVTKLGKDLYSLDIKFDKQDIKLEMKLDSANKDTIQGRVRFGNNSKPVMYKAIFPSDKKDEFKVLLKDGEKKYIFGRDFDGELYMVQGKKKVPVNSKNVERYQDYLDTMEWLDDMSFFTTKNPLWRNLNYLLLILLLFAEMKHDKNRRNQSNKEQ